MSKDEMILSLRDLPNRLRGVYFLKDKGVIVYVGHSRNIPTRIRKHISSDKIFDSYDYKIVLGSCIKQLESDYIFKLKPKYNYYSNPRHNKYLIGKKVNI